MKLSRMLVLALAVVLTCSCSKKPETVTEAPQAATEAVTTEKPEETTKAVETTTAKPTEAERPTETVKLETESVEESAQAAVETAAEETSSEETKALVSGPVYGEHGHIRFTIPESWGDEFSMDNHTDEDGTLWTAFHEEPDFTNGEGGWLCSVIQTPGNEITQYNYLPNYEYLGEIRVGGGKVYGLVIEYPSDVQPSIAEMDKYFKMYDDIEKLKNSITANGFATIAWGEGGVTEYIMPESNFVYFSEYDLKDMTKDELRLARNEIYARHGRRFNSADLYDYFSSKSWYVPSVDADKFDESVLNEAEKHNIKLIEEFEKKAK